jgi:hypothetical protein
MPEDLQVNDSAGNAPPEILRWVKRFQTVHACPMILSRETSGYHLYLPCPECLDTHGRRELADPKYAINLSMLAGLGDEFRDTTKHSWMPAAIEERSSLEKRREYGSGVCMRTRSSKRPHRFPIEELLHMGTVTERHPDILTQATLSGSVGSAEREEMWEEDPASKAMCPPPAGEMLPVTSLPEGHPAVVYLRSRGFDPAVIERQFRLSFCTKEYPYGQKGIYYRKMPGGWKDTPQHRIIFHSLIDGAPLTWQARGIEKTSEDGLNLYRLHPYAGGLYFYRDEDDAVHAATDGGYDGELQTVRDEARGGYWVFQWSHTDTRSNPAAAWQPVPPFDEVRDGDLRFKPSKYRTAKYSSRHLMGWDAAVERARNDPSDLKWCVLLEGPLDGARVGPGGIPLIGSSISEENAVKIASSFHIAFTGFDADKAGRDATEKITRILLGVKCRAPILNMVVPLPIPEGRDPGSLTDEEYQKIFQRALARSKRQS